MSDEYEQHMISFEKRVHHLESAMNTAIAVADKKFGTNNPANSAEAIGGHVGAIMHMVGGFMDAWREEIGPGLGEHIQSQAASQGPVVERTAAVVGELVEGAVESDSELGMGIAKGAVSAIEGAAEIVGNAGRALNHLHSSSESPAEGVGEAAGEMINGTVEPIVDSLGKMTINVFGAVTAACAEVLEAALELTEQLVEPMSQPAADVPRDVTPDDGRVPQCVLKNCDVQDPYELPSSQPDQASTECSSSDNSNGSSNMCSRSDDSTTQGYSSSSSADSSNQSSNMCSYSDDMTSREYSSSNSTDASNMSSYPGYSSSQNYSSSGDHDHSNSYSGNSSSQSYSSSSSDSHSSSYSDSSSHECSSSSHESGS